MPKKESYKDKWCPLSRLSLQQVENGGVKVVETGAFNQVLLSGTQQTYLSAHCVGYWCPYYRRGLNPWGWGRCILAPQRVGWYIICAALMVSAAVLVLLAKF